MLNPELDIILDQSEEIAKMEADHENLRQRVLDKIEAEKAAIIAMFGDDIKKDDEDAEGEEDKE